jgi:hypothetical protein
MKKIFTIVLLFTISLSSFAQTSNNYNEDIILNIDRNIYVVGENILLSAHLLTKSDKVISQLLYIEIITPDGKQATGNKVLLKDANYSGKIRIPNDLLTGNYYIRAYTKYMRNWNPELYSYISLKIVNPYNSESADHEINKHKLTTKYEIDTTKQFKALLNKPTYTFKETVTVNLEIQNSINDVIESTKVLVGLDEAIANSSSRSISKDNFSDITLLPESRGITLSGLVKDDSTKRKISYRKINLSIIDSTGNEFYSVFSDSLGRFVFNLPNSNLDKDFFVSAENFDERNIQLLIHTDYCNKEIQLPNPEFSLSETEKDVALKLIANSELNVYYNKEKKEKNVEIVKKDFIPFYGEPTGTLYINDYIALPTLEDYFIELPFLAKIRKEKGRKEFKILGVHPELLIYKPLVMIDLVPIYNINKLLKIDPKKIKKIDVITAPYILGDIIYGGLINIVSNKNDFAGISLPKSGIFLHYKYLSKFEPDTQVEQNDQTPDYRSTLYWNTDLKRNHEGNFNFDFKTGDTPGKYQVQITAITKMGTILKSKAYFEVK